MLDENGKMKPISDKTDKQSVLAYLKENSPDLKKYAFQEWTAETHEYVNNVITQVTGIVPSNTYAKINENIKSSGPLNQQQKPQGKSASGITSTELNLDDLNTGSAHSSAMDFELPEVPDANSFGIGGDLEDALAGI